MNTTQSIIQIFKSLISNHILNLYCYIFIINYIVHYFYLISNSKTAFKCLCFQLDTNKQFPGEAIWTQLLRVNF